MKTNVRALGLFLGVFGGAAAASIAAGGCGGRDGSVLIGAAAATSGSATSGGSGGDATTTTSGGGGEGQGGSSTTTSGGGGDTGSGGGAPASLADPDKDGPYQYKEIDDTTTVKATDSDVDIHCAYPVAGPSAGPYPVIVIAHGFQLGPELYLSYVKRLASFGYVAMTANFQVNIFGADNTANAQELSGALDWAEQKAELAGKADVNKAGMTGHSLGGKLALFAASMDPRVKASIVLDPVDGGMGGFGGGCNPPACVDMSAMMPNIPTGLLGETLDSMAAMFGQACAPAAENYDTFYNGAKSPSFEVTINGAAHMSFLDNPSCGFACNACKTETAPAGSVNAMSRAYVVAFYERYLRGIAGYDAYLTGAQAKVRYVDTGLATIKSK